MVDSRPFWPKRQATLARLQTLTSVARAQMGRGVESGVISNMAGRL
jgi:hypothetical protein